jgi:hypothetical protein
MSALQVAQISRILWDNRMTWNRAWDGGLVALAEQPGAARQLAGGMHITILSPERSALMIQSAQWSKEQEKRGLGSAAAGDSDEAAPPPEAPAGSRPATKSSSRTPGAPAT